MATFYQRVAVLLSRVPYYTKHGPGSAGGPGPCDPGCLKCEAEALLKIIDGERMPLEPPDSHVPAPVAPFKIGDVVALGRDFAAAPHMVVAGVDADDNGEWEITVLWFDRGLALQEECLDPSVLTMVPR